MVFILFGVLWVMSRGLLELLASWQCKFGCSATIVRFGLRSLTISCGVREMIGPLKDVKTEKSVIDLNLSFLKSLFGWMKHSSLRFC